MSFVDLYMGGGPLISGGSGGEERAVVFGMPFDSTHSYRPGARFGPDAIRAAFNNIEVFHPEAGVDLEGARIRDLGNAVHTVSAAEAVSMAGRITGELLGGGAGRPGRPLVALGGEHLITYGTYPRFPGGTGLVVFDAHYDLRDELGGARLSHGTYLRRLVQDAGVGADRIVHVGARAFAAEEAAFLAESGIATVTDAQVREGAGPRLLRDAASSFGSLYVSYDLDVLDPAFAPGVGNPEAVGITPRELFGMAAALGEGRVAGADIVELNPTHDTGAAAALAAKLLSATIAAS